VEGRQYTRDLNEAAYIPEVLIPNWTKNAIRDYNMQQKAVVMLKRVDEKGNESRDLLAGGSRNPSTCRSRDSSTGSIRSAPAMISDELGEPPNKLPGEKRSIERPETTWEYRKTLRKREREQELKKEADELDNILRGNVEVPNPKPYKATRK